MTASKIVLNAASGVGEDVTIENIFSIDLYKGTGTTKQITNGIDFAGKDGMVWAFNRDLTTGGFIYDTVRGKNNYVESFGTNPSQAASDTTDITSFNANGFSLGGNYTGSFNRDTNEHVAYSFRKAPNFFDVVTYTGNGSTQNISHNLEVAPGFIMLKRTDSASQWYCYHRGSDSSSPEGYYLKLNKTDARTSNTTMWNNTAPTSSVFSLGNFQDVNGSSATFVAYLFAHETGSDSMISCGSYTNSGSAWSVNLGWQPQWILRKLRDGTGAWQLTDSMRGLSYYSGVNARLLKADVANAENNAAGINVDAQGFKGDGSGDNGDYTYVAIRFPLMADITSSSGHFATDEADDNGSTTVAEYTSGFPVDMAYERKKNQSADTSIGSRGHQGSRLRTNDNSSVSNDSTLAFDFSDGWFGTNRDSNYHSWMWRRAKGYFDEVGYDGNGVADRSIYHSLGVNPEMIWVKDRESSHDWQVWHKTLSSGYKIILNSDAMQTTSNNNGMGTVSSTIFKIGNYTHINQNGNNYIAYLFATLDGVSKVGSFTGTGSAQTIDCGFTSGPKYVLIKCLTQNSTPWLYWDTHTSRGITASDDPSLRLDSTDSEATAAANDIEPDSTGFIVNSVNNTNNGSGQSYIFYAVAA